MVIYFLVDINNRYEEKISPHNILGYVVKPQTGSSCMYNLDVEDNFIDKGSICDMIFKNLLIITAR
jgi:hypothetical protein